MVGSLLSLIDRARIVPLTYDLVTCFGEDHSRFISRQMKFRCSACSTEAHVHYASPLSLLLNHYWWYAADFSHAQNLDNHEILRPESRRVALVGHVHSTSKALKSRLIVICNFLIVLGDVLSRVILG